MSSWNLNIAVGDFFLDFAWIGLLLYTATLLRTHLPFFQKHLLPANLIAGGIGLLIGMNGLGLIGLTTDRLGAYVYHLLALLFIALALRTPQSKLGLSSVKTGMAFIITYLVQALVGLAIAFALIYTIMPNLFAGIGLLPPLAFGMNPGVAYTFGQNWEQFGFESGGVVGLTFAAAGFLVAYTVGIALVKRGIKKGEAAYLDRTFGYTCDRNCGSGPDPSSDSVQNSRSTTVPGSGSDTEKDYRTYSTTASKPDARPSEARAFGLTAGRITTSPEIIESLSLHVGLVGLIYILTYGILALLELGLVAINAEHEIQTLWSFHFIAAAIIALFFRKGMDGMEASGVIDDTTMTRLSNYFMDFMIVASVAAISITVVLAYWLPLLLISVSVAITTWWTVHSLMHSAFKKYRLERFASVFGNMTGTIQSGLLLLRILDSGMKSPASYNLVYGSGFALILGFPVLVLVNVPVHYFDDPNLGYFVIMIAMLIYLLMLLAGWKYLVNAGSRS